jgi:transcriptional regulator with XRE-family HTH domain
MKSKHQERAQRVIRVFKDSNLNQRQFSELIDVSQQLVSAVINYKKRPNETILFGIIDNIKDIDPIWLITGVGKYNNSNVLNSNESNSLESKIEKIVEKRFEKLSLELNKKISNIEEQVKKSNANNVLRRIEQANSKLVPQLNKKVSKNLRG